MVRLGELWNNLSDEGKMPFREQAGNLQAQFKQDNPEYKYKARRKKRRAVPNQIVLPPGITSNEASYLMLLGAQALMSQKVSSRTASLAEKIAQLKGTIGELPSAQDESGIIPF
jgi:hypothetical protein